MKKSHPVINAKDLSLLEEVLGRRVTAEQLRRIHQIAIEGNEHTGELEKFGDKDHIRQVSPAGLAEALECTTEEIDQWGRLMMAQVVPRYEAPPPESTQTPKWIEAYSGRALGKIIGREVTVEQLDAINAVAAEDHDRFPGDLFAAAAGCTEAHICEWMEHLATIISAAEDPKRKTEMWLVGQNPERYLALFTEDSPVVQATRALIAASSTARPGMPPYTAQMVSEISGVGRDAVALALAICEDSGMMPACFMSVRLTEEKDRANPRAHYLRASFGDAVAAFEEVIGASLSEEQCAELRRLLCGTTTAEGRDIERAVGCSSDDVQKWLEVMRKRGATHCASHNAAETLH